EHGTPHDTFSRLPVSGGNADHQPAELTQQEHPEPLLTACIVPCLRENHFHFCAESLIKSARVEVQEASIQANTAHQLSPSLRRAINVIELIRSVTTRTAVRAVAVRRYALRPRGASSASAGSIQPSSSRRCSAV